MPLLRIPSLALREHVAGSRTIPLKRGEFQGVGSIV